jgi:hypothetical protein
VDTMVAVERVDKKKYRLTPPNGARLVVLLSFRYRRPLETSRFVT